jgi:hypothetical protein
MKSNTPDGEKKVLKKSKPQLKSLLPQMKSDSGTATTLLQVVINLYVKHLRNVEITAYP